MKHNVGDHMNTNKNKTTAGKKIITGFIAVT